MIFGIKMKRRFSPDSTMHVYQRSMSGFNIFYSLDDFLVFYTIVAVQARKYGITLLGLCLMIDHIHLLMSATTLSAMSRFISSYTSIFVREFNQRTGRKGPLFKSASIILSKSCFAQERKLTGGTFWHTICRRIHFQNRSDLLHENSRCQ